jgi:hypothetical protein
LLSSDLKAGRPPLFLFCPAIGTQTGSGNIAPALDALDQAHGDLPAENREPCESEMGVVSGWW